MWFLFWSFYLIFCRFSELMDSDLRAALFEGFDNEGEFEALDDDFVLQAMTEPEKPDFDFDQHIANLIARSEQMLGINKPRGWDGEDAKHLRKKVAYEDDEDEIESWVDEEEDGSRINVPQRSKVLGRTDFTEDDLDKILEDYDEDQIGELDEVGCILSTKCTLYSFFYRLMKKNFKDILMKRMKWFKLR